MRGVPDGYWLLGECLQFFFFILNLPKVNFWLQRSRFLIVVKNVLEFLGQSSMVLLVVWVLEDVGVVLRPVVDYQVVGEAVGVDAIRGYSFFHE